MSTARRASVQSVERAFDLIEALADGEELGVTELASRTGLVPSTAHRLLATLTKRGYVSHGSIRGRYMLGHKVIELGSLVDQNLSRLRSAARSRLENLRDATGESANLTVLDDDCVVYVDQAEGTHNVRMFTTVGATAPAHTTAAGKAMLACRAPEVVAGLYAPDRGELEQLTPHTLATVTALEEDLERTRRRGYGIDHEEHEEGVSCVAVPVFDHRSHPCAAISISGPSARIVHADIGDLADLLRRHAADVSAALGYHVADGVTTDANVVSGDGVALRPATAGSR